MRITLFKTFVHDQDEALHWYIDRLGFEVFEDQRLGDYRWLLVRAADNEEIAINLERAVTPQEQALVGRQGGGQPLFGLTTDDCLRDYQILKSRGVHFEGEPEVMPYGTGVVLQDLYGNKIYMSQELA